MKKIAKILSVVLAVSLIAGVLSGCGKKDGEDGDEPTVDPDSTVWQPTFYSLPSEIKSISHAVIADDMIYVMAIEEIEGGSTSSTSVTSESDGEDETTAHTVIYKISTDGQTYEKLANYTEMAPPEGSLGVPYPSGIALDKDGNIWVMELIYAYHYDVPEGTEVSPGQLEAYYVDDGTKMALRKLDPTGAELLSVDLSEMQNIYVNGLMCDKDGNVYFSDGNKSVYAYDTNGQQLLKADANNWVNTLVVLSDGRVAIEDYDSNSGVYIMCPVDVASKSIGASIPIGMNTNYVYSGAGDYLFMYEQSNALTGYNAETKTGESLFSLIGCDVDSDSILALDMLADGSVLALCRDSSGESGEIAVISERPASEVPQKTNLTIATMYTDYGLKKQILKFNRANDKYRINVVDYSEYNTEEDQTAGLTKLSTEIISGKVPDMIATLQMPMDHFAAIGLLEDLYPYLDSDPDLSREDYIPNILKAMETEGHLYEAASGFAIMSMVGRSDVVGEEMGWTVQEMMDIYNRQPEGTLLVDRYIDQESIIYYMAAMNLEKYVDWSTGTCNFNTQDFIDLLNFCSRFAKTVDYSEAAMADETENMRNGRQLLTIYQGSSFEDIQLYQGMFGGELTFKGMPTTEGVGNIAYMMGGIAMTTKCVDKDGAWSFIREIMGEEFQKSDDMWYFPVNQAAFDAKLAKSMEATYYTDPETGEKKEQAKGAWGVDGFMVDIFATTEEEAQRIKDVIASISGTVTFDESITDIIKEEARSFFNGEKTAEQAAELIQNRVTLYVNEQK